MTRRGALYVGCAGFSYPHWRNGVWYPRGLRHEHELRHYSQCFSTCEINSTFYGTPSEHTVHGWLESVRGAPAKEGLPPFRFCLKMRKSITHEEGCLSPELIERDLSVFLERAKALGEHLGPTLLQFPPFFVRNKDTIGALEDFLQRLPGLLRCAVEFRHASWYCDETYRLLRRHSAALVHHPLPELPNPPFESTCDDTAYVRLHGMRAEHEWDFTDEELRPYVDKVVAWRTEGKDVYVFFLNDADGNAPKNALSLANAVRTALGEKIPRLPDSNKITGYFSTASATTSPSTAAKHPHDTSPSSTDTPSKKPRLEHEPIADTTAATSTSANQRTTTPATNKLNTHTTPATASQAASLPGGKGSSGAKVATKKPAEEGGKGQRPLTSFFAKKA